MEDEEQPLRDWVGWEFLAAIALMAGGPIVGGLEKLLFISPATENTFADAVDVVGALMVAASVVMVFHVNLLNAGSLRTARRHLPDLVPFFATRQVRYIVVPLLTFVMAAGLNKLEQAGLEGFVGASIGVLGGLILIFTLDHRFMPRDETLDA